MSGRRQKAARRIGLLATAAATAAIAAGLVTRHKHASRAAFLSGLRHAGFAAAAAGDDGGVIAALSPYVAECPADAPALIRFARSRAAVDQPDGQNLRTAILTLDQVLRQSPANADARHALLEILPRTSDTETLERLDDEALAADPHDPAALRARVIVRLRQNRAEDALTAARAAAEASPDDIDARLTVLRLMSQARRTAVDCAAYAQSQFHDGDPRRLLLVSAAASAAGDSGAANAALLAAVARPLPDAGFALRLADALDDLHHYAAARTFLADAARRTGDVALTRALALRLWQTGRGNEVIAGLAGFDPTAPAADTRLLATRAMALFDGGHTEDGHRLVVRLAARRDRIAAAWAKALAAHYESTPDAPAAGIAALTRALTKDPSNGVFHAWLGEAYAATGEPAAALDHWTSAALSMPAWSAAHAGRADALLALGDPVSAADAAQAAFDRDPAVPNAVRVISARFAIYENTADPAAAAELLDATTRVQAARPFEPATLAIRVTLLARLGRRDEAASALRSAAARSADIDAPGLLRLADASRGEGLGVEDRLLRAAPPTPAVVLARATALAAGGLADAGHALFLTTSHEACDAIDWDLAAARFAALTQAPDAAARWQALQAANPDRPSVQLAVIEADADRNATAAAIERLHALGGDDGQQWKLARARWLTAAADADGSAEAVSLLSDLVRQTPRRLAPHLELARVLRRTGNVATALEQLRLARVLAPRDPRPLGGLVRLLQEQGRGDEAVALLRQAATAPALSTGQRVALADIAADAGDAGTAVDLLAAAPLSAAGRGWLAELSVRAGRTAAVVTTPGSASPAADDLTRLLAAPAADAERAGEADALRDVIAFPAAGAWTQLKAVAARFPADLALQACVVERALRLNETDVALAAARRGVSARPADPAAWSLPVRVLRTAGRWTALWGAADHWTAALGPVPVDGDVAAAEALLALHRPADAAARLRPRVDALRVTARPWPVIVFARVAVANHASAEAWDVLRPALANADVRAAARHLATLDLPAGDAVVWFDAIDAATPHDANAEQLPALAARAAVARRCQNAGLAARTLAAADGYANDHPADADAQRVRAGLLAQLHRPNAALAAVRSVLDIRPEDAAAHSDLACLLIDTHGDLVDAARHARAAVSARPLSATFHDTLARVEAARGHRAAAIAEYDEALRLDPGLSSAATGLAALTAPRDLRAAADE